MNDRIKIQNKGQNQDPTPNRWEYCVKTHEQMTLNRNKCKIHTYTCKTAEGTTSTLAD